MIRIKDHIFNDNEIFDISQSDFDGKRVIVHFINTDRYISIEKATFEDIEWNYENNNEYCNVFYEDIIKELKEENKKLKEENKHIFTNVNDDELLRSNAINFAEANELRQRIDKVIDYIEDIEEDKEVDNLFINKKEKSFLTFYKIKKDLIKILKGEENEN